MHQSKIEYLKKNKIKILSNVYDEELYSCIKEYIDSTFSKRREGMFEGEILQVLLTTLNFNKESKEGYYSILDVKNYAKHKYPEAFYQLKILFNTFREQSETLKPTDDINKIVYYAQMSYSLGMTIPYELADTIIRKIFFNKEKFSSAELKSAVISLGITKLEKNGIKDIPIIFDDLEQGVHRSYSKDSNTIIISNDSINRFFNKNDSYTLLDSVFQETEKVIQDKRIREDNLSFKNMTFIKNMLLTNSDEYSNAFMELYAHFTGELQCNKYLKNFVLEKYLSTDSYKKELRSEVFNIHKKMTDTVMFDDYFMNLTEEERNKCFLTFPILNVEYNIDGSSKHITEVIKEVERRLSSNFNLFYIFRKTKFKDSTISAELYSYLISYLKQSKEKTEEFNSELLSYRTKDPIVRKIIFSALKNVKEKSNVQMAR